MLNLFTYQVEQYSQFKDSVERLRTANRSITVELKNTAEDLDSTIKSESMNPGQVKVIQLLIEEMTESHACTPGLIKWLFLCKFAPSKHYQEPCWHH